MGRGRRPSDRHRGATRAQPAVPHIPSPIPPPIPLDPVDLLAGLAPGVELHADDAPAGVDAEVPDPVPARLTVADAGKLVRAGESTIRRLIRSPALRPIQPGERRDGQPDRAGVLPRTRGKPGE